MKWFVGGIAITLFLGMLIGCGEEFISPLNPDSTNPPLALVLNRDENGRTLVCSPEGRTYTEEALQEVIKTAAQRGRSLETTITVQPSLDKSGDKTSSQRAAPPRSPTVRLFMSDVTPTWDGVRVTLTDLGLNLGLSWQGAWTLACYTLFEYELQEPSCANWPNWFYQATRAQIQLEMWYHCLAYYYWHSPMFREVNIAFGDLP